MINTIQPNFKQSNSIVKRGLAQLLKRNVDFPYKTSVTWIKDHSFLGNDGSNSVILGEGGVSPLRSIFLGIAACASYDLLEIMKKQKTPLEKLEISVDGIRDEKKTGRPIKDIHMVFKVGGNNVKQKKVEKAVDISINQYCGVYATIKNSSNVTYEVVMED
ncbi:protein yhfa [Anaeramoeba flamelloides]|uniref:Protein yhfa n=1 Tax=Anaeramoeba flamelloides TaxID=1746091 RepID=A0AAV8A6E8_9EUKA|nr:protein yhfa [Anaeramoeba flamelloides]KAJ6233237.1 protein yhfa [Anaeramoeba flamelloides]|eukprot:Anaeramoba_flamelloidesa332512_254.p1 GENE.a332512_254~~a332512_254.p1  ORF type:complete len:161 (+),score=33.73 a332512_254:2-484(+)